MLLPLPLSVRAPLRGQGPSQEKKKRKRKALSLQFKLTPFRILFFPSVFTSPWATFLSLLKNCQRRLERRTKAWETERYSQPFLMQMPPWLLLPEGAERGLGAASQREDRLCLSRPLPGSQVTALRSWFSLECESVVHAPLGECGGINSELLFQAKT